MSSRSSLSRVSLPLRNFLCVLALLMSGASQAQVTYTFSGVSSIFEPDAYDVLQTFSITVPDFITSETTISAGDSALSSCTSAVESCVGVRFAFAPFSPEHDIIDFKTDETGTYYYFEAGVFGAVGTYQSQLGFHPATLTVAAIPEPEAYAMMLAGLGVVGFMVRRRKQKTA